MPGTGARRPVADENFCLAGVAGNEALAGAVPGSAGVAAAAAAAAMVTEERQQGALVVATAAVGVTPILPVGLAAAAAAAPSLDKDLVAVTVVVDGWQLMLIPMGEAAQPSGVVAQFAAAVAAAELLHVVAAVAVVVAAVAVVVVVVDGVVVVVAVVDGVVVAVVAAAVVVVVTSAVAAAVNVAVAKLFNLLAEQRYCFQQLRTQPTAGAGTFFSCHPTGAPSVAPSPCSSPLPPVPLEPPSSLLLDTSLPARVATKSARRLPLFNMLPLFKSANPQKTIKTCLNTAPTRWSFLCTLSFFQPASWSPASWVPTI